MFDLLWYTDDVCDWLAITTTKLSSHLTKWRHGKKAGQRYLNNVFRKNDMIENEILPKKMFSSKTLVP